MHVFLAATSQVTNCKNFLLSMESHAETFNTTIEKKRHLYRVIANALSAVSAKDQEIMVSVVDYFF